MKFRLIIDQNHEEEIVATVKQKSTLIDYIQALVESDGNNLIGYYNNQIVKLDINKIECIYIENNKTFVSYDDERTYLVKKRLHEIEEILPVSFIRISKSAIANSNKIEKFITTITGGVNVEFKNGYKDYVSRRCFRQIKRSYDL